MKRGMEIQEEGMMRNSFYGDDEKTEKNRERNREHARKTRQRKKEMIEGTKGRLIEAHREVSLWTPRFFTFYSSIVGYEIAAATGRK